MNVVDIKIEKENIVNESHETGNYFEDYARNALEKLFHYYDFIQSANVFFRGSKHPTKKVKIKLRLKGKEVFVEASAEKYPAAIDAGVQKLKNQLEKYKTQHYKRSVAGNTEN